MSIKNIWNEEIEAIDASLVRVGTEAKELLADGKVPYTHDQYSHEPFVDLFNNEFTVRELIMDYLYLLVEGGEEQALALVREAGDFAAAYSFLLIDVNMRREIATSITRRRWQKSRDIPWTTGTTSLNDKLRAENLLDSSGEILAIDPTGILRSDMR